MSIIFLNMTHICHINCFIIVIDKERIMKLFDFIFDKVPVKKTVSVKKIQSPKDLYYDNLFTPVNDYPDLDKVAKELKKELTKKYAI